MLLSRIIECLLLLYLSSSKTDCQPVILVDNHPQIITLPANGVVILQQNDNSTKAFVVCQAHVQAGLITLSEKSQIQYGSAVSGRDIGVVSTLPNTALYLTWYLYSNTTHDVSVLVHSQLYNSNDPLPGGCNEEFSLENDPNIHLKAQDTKTRVQFQRSNVAAGMAQCEDQTLQSDLEYLVYVRFIPGGMFTEQAYLTTMTDMLTVTTVKKHGTWLKTLSSDDESQLFVSSYKQQGVMYTVLVRDKKQHTEAVYIPAADYSCDIDKKRSCEKRDVVTVIFSTVGALVGVFLCLFGHRFFKTEIFIFGCFLFALVSYQVIALETQISDVGTYALSGILGLIGGVLLLGFWWYKGIPVISVLFISLVPGYLLSSILFYTPFGNISYWSTPYNYGAVFACGVLIGPVILLFFTRFLNIFSCALVGSFIIIVALDVYIMSGMRYILVNSLRHGTDRSYVKVVVTGPYTKNEIALTVVWGVLCVVSIIFQMYRERRKAPFPPCPRQLYDRSADLRRLLKPEQGSESNIRRPLLGAGQAGVGQTPYYGTVGNRIGINGDTDQSVEVNREDESESETDDEIEKDKS